MLVFVLNIPRL